MARSLICVVCVVICLSLVLTFPSDDIVTYKDPDILQTALREKNQFVLFCKPKDTNCKRIIPIWKELLQLYEGDHSIVKLALVLCTDAEELCADQKIKNVPVFRFYYKNSDDFSDYRGRRTFESLHRFVEDEIHNAEDIIDPALPDAVVELGAKRFQNFVSERLHFVHFYTPWCGHCKVLHPVWHHLALNVAGGVHLFISQVDCSKHSSLCAEYDIRSFPSLVLFYNGEKVESYTGSRSLKDLKAYVKSRMDQYVEEYVPEVQTENGVLVLTENSFSHIINNNLVFVNFHTPWCSQCKELNSVWEQLAEASKDRGIMLASVNCERHPYLCDTRSVKIFPTLTVYQKGMHLYDYNGNQTLTDLKKIISLFTGVDHDEL